MQEWSDERLRQTNEVLQGIRLLKLCGWEMDFAQRILKTRKKELKLLDKDSLYWALMSKIRFKKKLLESEKHTFFLRKTFISNRPPKFNI